eukprot:Skav236513  [mRNA]  locus=scaffold78:567425:568639:+ [translate_table: standard]
MFLLLLVLGLRLLRGEDPPSRELQGSMDECQLRAARILPTPKLSEFDLCTRSKLAVDSHDWGVPGAEYKSWVDCWCSFNVSEAVAEVGCCEHDAFAHWCNVECEPDCQSAVATSCIQECPSMCFESRDYVLPKDLCSSCRMSMCFPVLKCLLSHAENLTLSGELNRTCHEVDFVLETALLENYWQCWLEMPKHSSHWNVLSANVHCSCREGMQDLAKITDCCGSVTYAGGICELHCPREAECDSQDAQSCIQNCNVLCHAKLTLPSEECKAECLNVTAPCRKYLGCRTPIPRSYVCDDGEWPDSSTGCCVTNTTDTSNASACPSECETRLVYRVDTARYPWWWGRSTTPIHPNHQCTCAGCPVLNGTSEVTNVTPGTTMAAPRASGSSSRCRMGLGLFVALAAL